MKKFLVLGTVYRHIRSKDLPSGVMGYCDGDSKIIATCASLKGIQLLATVLHELDHATNFESGVVQTMDRTQLEVMAETKSRVMMDNFSLRPKASRVGGNKKPKAKAKKK